ncbi:BatD family protein [Pseudoxanthomonas mexicana]|uniref:BatD family protein n=1 Tax=Pseudoxanthomonas mexicana TaxID=128785 RepID=UPI00398B4C1D
MKFLLTCLFVLGALAAGDPARAQATARAWLEPQQIALGETVTLHIEGDGGPPDPAPLVRDFVPGELQVRRMASTAQGAARAGTTWSLVLTPRRAGRLVIPPLQVGAQRTAPQVLQVLDAPAAAPGDARIFLETVVDDVQPYVQQSVGVAVRLHYAVPLVSGQLDLDAPEGALLQKVGDDLTSSREINGRRYHVVERRFLLVPDRSGTITLPAPRFSGRGAGGWLEDFLGGNSREMRAAGNARTLQVRAQPDGAPQPWLPLRDLRLRYVAAPQRLRAGEAAALVIEATALGATYAQLPELPAPSAPGAQVFAEPAQYEETFDGGTPQVRVTRRYSIVPGQAGTLSLAGPSMAWWDVQGNAARRATLPDLRLEVEAGSGSFAMPALAPSSPSAASQPAAPGAGALPAGALAGEAAAGIWPWLAAAFALLWLATLVWALRRRAPDRDGIAAPSPAREERARPRHGLADLKRVLDTGDLDEVGDVLRGMAAPPARDLDELIARLSPPAQRAAVERMRRARWAGGDAVAARAALREAFARGPQWQAAPREQASPLPPLYPPG